MMPLIVIFFIAVLALIFVTAIVLLIVFLTTAGKNNRKNARNTVPGQPVPSAYPDALRILDERYARGEISPEQYRMMKQDILNRGQ